MVGAGTQSAMEANPTMLRIDAAHRTGPAVPTQAELPAEPVTTCVSTEAAAEQMQVQAGQLARHLQDRRRDMDQRESQLNARIAQLENELRVSRLWQREQVQEFGQKEAELREQLTGYEARIAGLAMAEAALEESRKNFAEAGRLQNEDFTRREQNLQEAQSQIKHEAAKLAALREQLEVDRQQLARERSDETWKHGLQELHCLQQAHREQFSEWQQEHTDWQHRSQQQEQELAARIEAVELQHRRWQEEREFQQQQLEQQREQLDERRITIERSRGEIAKLHRETLEMRWVAEQLWSQLTSRVLPADLAVGSVRLKSQLADEFRFQQQELEARQKSIQELLSRLEAKRTELIEQRRELTAWFGRRQLELSQKAHALSEKEQELAHLREQFNARQIEWQTERRLLHRQVQEAQLQRVRTSRAA